MLEKKFLEREHGTDGYGGMCIDKVTRFMGRGNEVCKLRVNLIEYSIAYFLISSILQIIPSIVIFLTIEGSF